MIRAGLTGGIATGKSTVVDILRRAGARIIDADQIAREVVQPGQPAWEEICAFFGRQILNSKGEIDRDKLGGMVFKDPSMRHALEAIIHPRVGQEIDARLDQLARDDPKSVVIMDIPLLFETKRTQDLDEIIVVYADERTQLERLMKRNHLTQEEARARIDSQMPIEEKKTMATLIIDNNGPLAQTKAQALSIYERLAQRA